MVVCYSGKEKFPLLYWVSQKSSLVFFHKSPWKNPTELFDQSNCILEKNYDKPRQHIKKERHHFADKASYSQSCGFSSSHV